MKSKAPKYRINATGNVRHAAGTTEVRVVIPRKYDSSAREYVVGLIKEEVVDREQGKVLFERIDHV